MYLIQQITSDACQQQTLVLPDGSSLFMQMYFSPIQQSWLFQQLVWGTFTLNRYKIVNSPNLLNQWKNIIPFGIACYSTNNRDPGLQEDFSSGNSLLYILTAAEVLEVTTYLQGGSLG